MLAMGRETHLSVKPILAISSSEVTSRYSSQDMCALQLEDKYIAACNTEGKGSRLLHDKCMCGQ